MTASLQPCPPSQASPGRLAAARFTSETSCPKLDTSPNRTWDDTFAHDVAYVDQVTLGLDAKILAKTVLILLRGRKLDRQTAIPRFDEMMANREGAEDA